MRIPRIYTPGPLMSGTQVSLEDDAANHVTRVLRLKPGAPLVLFDGTGSEFDAILAATGKRDAVADVGGQRAAPQTDSSLELTLIQAISRGERMDFTLQKAVELGVNRIVPVFSARSVVSLDGERRERRHEHWSKIIVSACEQSGRARLPELLPLQTLEQALGNARDGLRLVLDPVGTSALSTLPPSNSITLLVGPEGGLDDTELTQARAAGFQGMRLGPRILRTETAALVALAVLQTRWGDLT